MSNCDDGKGYVLACQEGTCTCTVDAGAPKSVSESAITFSAGLPTFASLTAACSAP